MKTNDTTQKHGFLWPLWGVAAGALGAIAHIGTLQNLSQEEYVSGPAAIELLSQTRYHVGVVAGILAVFCLLVLAAGWRRWLAERAPDSLMANVVPLAMTASAGALILAYGFKGMLAIYLPGGMDHGWYPTEGLMTLFAIDDMAPFMGWYGVAMAAAALGIVSLKEGLLPKWFGILSVLFAIIPLGILFIFALPGFPGVILPAWAVITGIGLTISLRRAERKASVPAQVAMAAR
jgi:hypothetical protein